MTTDELERLGWEVAIADAQRVKGLAPLAGKTNRIDAWVLAELSARDLVLTSKATYGESTGALAIAC